MKIVSLIPSATELVFALGRGDDLVGVTDGCDYPDAAVRLPVVSRSLLLPSITSPAEIDAEISRGMDEDGSIHALETEVLRELHPDLVLTQDHCGVCGVPGAKVREALDAVGSSARVVSLDPRSLEDVFDSFETAGEALERSEQAEVLAADARRRVEAVRGVTSRLPAYRVLALEWPEPPRVAGYWVPEMIDAAGGVNLLSTRHQGSIHVAWKEVADSMPEIVAFMPRGYYLEEAEEAARDLFDNGHFRETSAAVEGNVFAFDSSATFSRPGPRLIEGLEALAWAIHPEAFPEPAPGTVSRVGR